MKKVLFAAAALTLAALVIGRPPGSGDAGRAEAGREAGRRRADRQPARASEPPHGRGRSAAEAPIDYQAMVTRYCVGCHNTRNPLPAGAPLALDKANLADPGADAATWERVVKKLASARCRRRARRTPGARGAGEVPLGARRQPRRRGREEEQPGHATSCTA